MFVDSWSGDQFNKPQIEDSTVKLFWSDSRGQPCAMGDVFSLEPGLARIQLEVTDDAGVLGLPGGGPAQPVLKHQFLAGWLKLNDPAIREMAASDFPASAQPNATAFLGDPAGDGHFVAGGNPGIVQVKVTGSMPMGSSFANFGLPATVTLPQDWPALANALAVDADPDNANPALRWDIHDDTTDREGHVAGYCGPGNATIDAVDNCQGGGPLGPFSRVFGDSSSDNAVGPFDALRPDDTLLSDGQLTADDAPMPAARIDVGIAPNSGAATDISGVGSLSAISKVQTYSRDFTGASTPHNLYAPFYAQYIPATDAPSDAASGVDGPAAGNDFTGFLVDGQYDNWDIAHTFTTALGGPTTCLRRSYDPQRATPATEPESYYQLPSGDQKVAVYTDEHGEAQVAYNPGTGFFFDSLIALGRAIGPNANGGCDLQDVGVLGTSAISAKAQYPYKPVNDPAHSTTTITKDVTSLWSKTLSYYPKGPGAANANARIVVAHAQDIDGSPFAHEVICFSSNAESMSQFAGVVQTPHGPIDLRDTTGARDPRNSIGRVCVRSNADGNAGVEVLESNPVHVNVIGDFTNEGILRAIDVDFTTPGSSQDNPSPTPPGGTGTGTTPPTAAELASIPRNQRVNSGHAKQAKGRLAYARLVKSVHGKRSIKVRVNSALSLSQIRVRMYAKHHKLVTTRTLTIRTNRAVTLKVRVASRVRSIRVTVLR
jgi:hypothetical protein